MSLGIIDRSSYSPSSSRIESRPNVALRMDFDRPTRILDSRISPSPGPSRSHAGYDSYVPLRAIPLPRGGPNSYRPGANSWRPDEDRSYRPRTPSPDHHEPRYTDAWTSYPQAWPERRQPSPPPSWDRPRPDVGDILAQRMFEPSASWKQTHVPGEEPDLSYDRPPRSPEARFRERRPSPPFQRAIRDDFNSYRPGPSGDSYRPAPSRGFRGPRQPDSYRPQYDDAEPWTPQNNADVNSIPIGRFRRGPRSSNSPPRGRAMSRDFDGSRYSSRDRSFSGSRSPRSTRYSSPPESIADPPTREISEFRSGSHWEPRGGARYRMSANRARRKRCRSRSSSRSSTDSRHYRPKSPLSADFRGPSTVQSPISANFHSPATEFKPGLKIQTDGLQPLASNQSSPDSTMANGKRLRTDELPAPHPSLPPRPPLPLAVQNAIAKIRKVDRRESQRLAGVRPLPMRGQNGSQRSRRKKKKRGSQSQKTDSAVSASTPMELSQSPQVGWKETPIELPPAAESEALTPPAALTIADVKAVSLAPDVQMDMLQPISPAPASPVEQKPEAWLQPQIEPVLSQTSLPPSSAVTEPTPPTEERAIAQLSSVVSSTELSFSLKSPAPLEVPLNLSVAPSCPSEPEDRAEVPAPPSIPKTVVDVAEERNMTWQTKEARSLQEALQLVVAARHMYDRQPREARVNPVLMANHALHRPLPASTSTPESLMDDVLTGDRHRDRMDTFMAIRPALAQKMAERQETLEEKTKRLRQQYLEMHEAWQNHCARLDNLSQIAVPEEVATVTGRTTRRSAAVLGDAVRSDLEMEQIIASLGNEDMMDPAYLSLRNVATIPDMISVTHGTVDYMFDDTNNEVDDPASFYETGRRMGSWTEEEQVIFLEKFAAHPKQFGIIADSLPHKTQAECVQFYYMHKKKIIDFRRLVSRYGPRKRGGRKTDKKKGNALLADILKHDAEVSKRSKTSNGRRKRTAAAVSGEPRRANSRRTAVQAAQVEQTPTTTPTPEPEAEPRPKRRRVGNSRLTTQPPEPEDVNCDAADVEPQPRPRRARKTRKTRGAVAASVTPPDVESSVVETRASTRFIDQTESTSRRKATAATVHWSDDDKALFLKLLSQYGDDFKRIAASMPNKTTIQVSAFYKANQVDLDLKQVAACAPKRSPTPDMSSENGKAVPPLPGTGIMSPSTNTIILANGIESTSLSVIPYEASEKATRVFDASVSLAGLPYPPAVSDTMHGLADDAGKRPYTQILPRPRTASGDYPSDLRIVDAQPPPSYSPFSQKPYTYSTPHPSPNPLFPPPPAIVSSLFSATSPPVSSFGVPALQPPLEGSVVASYTEPRLPGSLDSHRHVI